MTLHKLEKMAKDREEEALRRDRYVAQEEGDDDSFRPAIQPGIDDT